MANLFGTGINQVPTNGMLGSLAFQDKAYVAVDAIGIGTTFVDSGTASQPLQVAGGGYFSGSVGIGTTNPGAKLDVYGTSRFGGTTSTGRRVDITTEGIVTLASGNNANSSNLILQNASDTGATTNHGNSILWQFGTSTTTAPINAGEVKIAKELQWTTTATTQDAYFSISLALDGTVGEKLRVTSSGNLGIGTTNPAYPLDIYSSATSNILRVRSQYGTAETIIGDNFIKFFYVGGSTIDFATSLQFRDSSFNPILYLHNSTKNVLVGTSTATGTASQPLQVAGGGYFSGNVGIGTTNPSSQLHITGQFQSTRANSATTGGGQIYLNGANGNRIDFSTAGVAAPAFTTRSAGTKLVLYPSVGASLVDYALGIETATLWSSVPDSSYRFKWYAGTTNIASLFGTGELVLGTTSLTGTTSQPLQVTGGAYVSGSVGIGTTNPTSTLQVSGTFYNSGIGTFANGDTTYGTTSASSLELGLNNNSNAGTLKLWGTTTNAYGLIQATTSNLHIDCVVGAVYLNYYDGNFVSFGTGAGAESARFTGSTGTLTLGSITSTGTASQPLQVTGGAYVSGSVGIGTTNPAALLHLSSGANTTLRLTDTAGSYSDIIYNESGSVSTLILDADPTNSSVPGTAIIMKTDGSECLRVDALGRLLVGTNTARVFDSSTSTLTPLTQIESTGSESAFSIVRNNAASTGPGLFFGKSRSGANGGTTVVQIEDRLGTIFFEGTDGTNLIEAASIFAQVDGTPGTNDMPGRLVFATTADGASSPTEQMRITSAGNVGIGTTDPTSKLAVSGFITENSGDGTFWNVVTQKDVGYSANQVPLNQYLGQLAFLDAYSPAGLRRTGGGSDDVVVSSTGLVGIGTASPTTTLDVVGSIKGAVTSGAVQASTAGTAINFTGIPSWVKRITVGFNAVKTSGTSPPLIQIGSSALGYTSTGYTGSNSVISNASAVTANFTNGIGLGVNTSNWSSSQVVSGTVTFVLVDSANNTWSASGIVGSSNATVTWWTAGAKSLATSNTLDRIRVTTSGGTETFAGGSINILYEG